MPTRELLRIKDFAGIRDAEIELSRMNVFIGPQASGKSVSAKLLFYFKRIIEQIPADLAKHGSKPSIRSSHREIFSKYFPPDSWAPGSFQILYQCGQLWIQVDRRSSTVDITYSDYYSSLLGAGRKAVTKPQDDGSGSGVSADQYFKVQEIVASRLSNDGGRVLANVNYFVPAGRSFFSVLSGSVFSLLTSDVVIDPFLSEFGRLYENIRVQRGAQEFARTERGEAIKGHVARLLCGVYERAGRLDYIRSHDGRRVLLENSSSGQQESLPLTLLLSRFSQAPGTKRSRWITFFVEEPETHLFPSAQREIVHLLSAVTDLSSDENSGQYVVTTHSPYILTALNNLMYGDQIVRDDAGRAALVHKILDGASPIKPDNVRAYAFGDGGVNSIIDSKTGLVDAEILDSVSGQLASEFDALVNLAFEVRAA